jgi:SAM-dependent methyltransferase
LYIGFLTGLAWLIGIRIRIPPEVEQAFQSGGIPEGPVLDLGCGTGTNVIYMAKQGRQAIGIDFVPQAIAKARLKAQKAGVSAQTGFIVGDVTRLKELNLPRVSYALDMGCFHGLKLTGSAYARSSPVLIPWKYMLWLDP